MALCHRRPAGRRRALVGLALAGAVTVAAAPAVAGPAGTEVRSPAAAALLPLEGSACLFPIPGQECSEEERRLCDPPPAPDPVVVDCHDPANAWVREMVGECDMPHLSAAPAAERERDRSRDGSCLDAESCSAPRPAASATTSSSDFQPAIDRVPALAHDDARRLTVVAATPRRHPGYARGIERPPRA